MTNKKFQIPLIILIVIMLLAACDSRGDTRSIPDPQPTTSAGTPISDDPSLYEITQIETPGSTCFSSIGYDSGTGTLVVTFRDSGASYAYDEVPKSVWNALQTSDSMGGYYNKNIKGQYDCTKLG